jgi:hypothetical protein
VIYSALVQIAVRSKTLPCLKDSCRTHSGHSPVLLDDLVSAGEDQGRDRQAELPGGLEINQKLEFGRLLYRQIGRLGAFEDSVDIAACTAVQIGYFGAIDDQCAIRE